jgi:hypothetical protein
MDRMAVQQDLPQTEPSADEQRGEIEARSRSLRNGLISLAVFFVLGRAAVGRATPTASWSNSCGTPGPTLKDRDRHSRREIEFTHADGARISRD